MAPKTCPHCHSKRIVKTSTNWMCAQCHTILDTLLDIYQNDDDNKADSVSRLSFQQNLVARRKAALDRHVARHSAHIRPAAEIYFSELYRRKLAQAAAQHYEVSADDIFDISGGIYRCWLVFMSRSLATSGCVPLITILKATDADELCRGLLWHCPLRPNRAIGRSPLRPTRAGPAAAAAAVYIALRLCGVAVGAIPFSDAITVGTLPKPCLRELPAIYAGVGQDPALARHALRRSAAAGGQPEDLCASEISGHVEQYVHLAKLDPKSIWTNPKMLVRALGRETGGHVEELEAGVTDASCRDIEAVNAVCEAATRLQPASVLAACLLRTGGGRQQPWPLPPSRIIMDVDFGDTGSASSTSCGSVPTSEPPVPITDVTTTLKHGQTSPAHEHLRSTLMAILGLAAK